MADTQTVDADEIVASSPEELRDQALRRVKKRRDLHTHVFAYIAVNVLVWGLWAVIGMTSHSWYPWPLWLTLGWGLGLVFNTWDVYFRHPITEADIRREMDRLKGPSRPSTG